MANICEHFLVTRKGLLHQTPKYQSMTCPPNAQVDETFQHANLDKILQNASDTFEEDYVKLKFPTLARIIFNQQGTLFQYLKFKNFFYSELNDSGHNSIENINYMTDEWQHVQPSLSSPCSEIQLLDTVQNDTSNNHYLFDSVFGRLTDNQNFDSISNNSTMISQLSPEPELSDVFTDSSVTESPQSVTCSVKQYFSDDYNIRRIYEEMDIDPDMALMTSISETF